MLKSIIIEGIDRLGKDTLIKEIMDRLRYFLVIHFQKPEILGCILKDVRRSQDLPDNIINDNVKMLAQKQYQQQSFINMMKLLSSDASLILNRAHLGEYVYSPRYRNYSGDYVFDLEMQSNFLDTTLLIVLHTSSFDFIKDDGLSFDFDKKEDEQMDFIRAFEKSNIKHKLLLDVNDSKGSFVPSDKLARIAIQAFQELPSMQHQIMHTYWEYDEESNLNAKTFLQPNPSKIIN
jgi:thymidylate kinase